MMPSTPNQMWIMRLFGERAAQPGTVAGRWLQACLLRQDERRDRILEEVSSSGWNSEDTLAVVRCAFTLALYRFPHNASEEAVIEQLIEGLRRTFGAEAPDEDALRAEIRRAFAGDHGPSREINAPTELRVYSLVTFHIAGALRMSRRAITKLVVNAERWANDLGWKPTPAS